MGASEKTAAGVSTLPLLHLPQDILVEILSNLPAKSLVRFRCVSKFFYALVVDHGFGVMHRSLSLKLPSRAGILISISSRSSPAYYTINFSEQNAQRPGMLQANRLAYLDSEPFLKGSLLRSSSDGLICLSKPNGDVVVCNVSTGQRISLPRIQFHSPHRPSICAQLGFNSQSKRYKVLMSTWMFARGKWSTSFEYKHWVLTVGVDKSWREINYSPHPFEGYGSLIDSDATSVYIDGFIYSYNWLTKADPPSFHIVAFEVGSESYSLIPFPAEVSLSQEYPLVGYLAPFRDKCRDLLRDFALLQVDGGRLAIVFVRKIGHLSYMDVWTHLSYMDVWTWEISKECWEKITMIIPLEESIDIPHRFLRYTTNHVGEIVLLCINRERFSILICNLKSEVWRQFDVGGVEEFPTLCPEDVRIYRIMDNVFSLE
ncbi:putative F-box protein At3g52320 [Ipomoea triloba]|uniref:putative F-box protein At3g52320 n=1 Tax=Ipomoea triloba TaxID=35885 RepID=UPI00125E6A29|nr:putative F-box protein At3g52320 [Ipomoea triloba]